MTTTARHQERPLIGIAACVRIIEPHPFHIVGEKYITAVADGAEALPLLIPALGDALGFADLVDRLDGLLFTGSPSNVAPQRYGGPASTEGTLHDPQRDATTLPLIEAALADGLPLFAICRGLQELNVALGGTLHQRVQEVPGRADHRARRHLSLAEQYAPVHPVRLTPGGALAALAGLPGGGEVMVNSLHAQGIDRPAPRLEVEAVAPDGTIEAVRVRDAKAFALAVQWHPEWRAIENPLSLAMLRAFGEAARARRARRQLSRVA